MNSMLQFKNQVKIERVDPIIIEGTRGYREWVIVRVSTDQGIEGIGEGFAWNGQAAKIRSHIYEINRQISGTSPIKIEAFLKQFIPQAHDRNWYSAISAVEIALLDIVGKLAGLPIYSLLGGAIQNKLPLYANHGFFQKGSRKTPEEVIIEAKEAGYAMFKWDPFFGSGTPNSRELSKEIDSISRVREAVGKDYPLAIDAHNRFSVDGAIMAAKALEPLNIMFFEAPTQNDPEKLKQVAKATSIPLATGELTCNRWEAKKLLDSGALKIFQPEVGTNGGILESCRTTDLAELYNVQIATHNWCGPILTRAASHVCARAKNLLFQEYAGGASQNHWEHELLDPPTQIENGHIILTDRPGLGSVLNEKLLASIRID